ILLISSALGAGPATKLCASRQRQTLAAHGYNMRSPYRPRRGRVKLAVDYALTVADGQPVSTSQIMQEWSHFEQRLIGNRNSSRDRHNYHRAIRRACEQLCVRAGRSTSIGRPILWKLRD